MQPSSRRRYRPQPVQFLIDVHDDRRVLRAVETHVAGRRGAVVVRPTPGCHGRQNLYRDVVEAAGLSMRRPRGGQAESALTQAANILRRARVRELWVLRAHTTAGWVHLGEVAASTGARLVMVLHAAWPCPHLTAGLQAVGLSVAPPRVLRLTRDSLSLALGITPAEGWSLHYPGATMWLPAVS